LDGDSTAQPSRFGDHQRIRVGPGGLHELQRLARPLALEAASETVRRLGRESGLASSRGRREDRCKDQSAEDDASSQRLARPAGLHAGQYRGVPARWLGDLALSSDSRNAVQGTYHVGWCEPGSSIIAASHKGLVYEQEDWVAEHQIG